MDDDRPKPEKDEKGRFVSGNIGGGRSKGSRNKLGEAFISDLLDDWSSHGKQAIIDCRTGNPVQYVKTVASILPSELNVKVGDLDELSDEQLERQLRSIVGQLAEAGLSLIAGDRPQAQAQPALDVPTVQ